MLGFGLAVFAQVAEAKAPIVSISTSVERGNFISIGAGTKWKSKSVVVEVGVKSKKTWKWSRVASGKTDKLGMTTFCSSRTLNAGTQLRLKSGAKIISTIKIVRAIQLSGCGYSPSVPVAASIAPTTTVAAPTTTTVPASTPAPTSLALSAATDTGDSQSDGITKETSLVIVGSAQANSSVQVYVDGASSGSACTANGSGAFSCSLGTVTEGTKAVTAKAAGTNGESVASQAFTVVVDRTKPTVSWSPNGNIWGGANEDFPFTFTVSETTTTLSVQDVRMVCSIQDACAINGFGGSGTTYSVTFSTINNFGNGGFIGLFGDSFSDVAGNTNNASSGATIMLDTSGPQATLSRVDGYIHITFNEVPVDFTQMKLELQRYDRDVWLYGLGAGGGFNNFGSVGTSGRVWRFLINDYYSMRHGDESYRIELDGLTDVDGNYSSDHTELDWP